MLKDREAILESWKKCLEYGVNKELIRPKLYEKRDIMTRELKSNHDLINIFINKVSNLLSYNVFKLEKHVFLLLDKRGMLLSLYCKKEIKEKLYKKGLKAGVYLTEKSCGTNAISLARELNNIILLSKDEHYCSYFQNWDCIAAPLKINNSVIGYIDISLINCCFNKELVIIVKYLISSIILEYITRTYLSYKKSIDNDLKDVLIHTAKGFSIKEISEYLHISESSVKYRRAKLCEIFDAKNLYEVIGIYFANNFIDL